MAGIIATNRVGSGDKLTGGGKEVSGKIVGAIKGAGYEYLMTRKGIVTY